MKEEGLYLECYMFISSLFVVSETSNFMIQKKMSQNCSKWNRTREMQTNKKIFEKYKLSIEMYHLQENFPRKHYQFTIATTDILNNGVVSPKNDYKQ